MNPRTKRNLILITALVLLVAAVILWAKTPRTFEQAMGNGFDRIRVDQVHAFVPTVRGGEADTHEVTLYPEDPAYEELWTLLDEQEFYPAMRKVQSQQMQLDHYAYLSFLIQEEDSWYSWRVDMPGSRYIQFLGYNKSRHFSPSGGLDFQQDVIDLLLAQPYTSS